MSKRAGTRHALSSAIGPGTNPRRRSQQIFRICSIAFDSLLAGVVAGLRRKMGEGGIDFCKATRPVPSTLNHLLNSSHETHMTRKAEKTLHFPVTSTYRAFDAEAAQATEDGWKPEDAQMALWGPKVRNPSAVGSTTTSFISSIGSPVPGSYHLLEVVCQYNATVQATDLKGTPGLPIRPPSIPTIGPVSTLFRWYARRDLWLMKSEKLDDLSIVPEGDRFGVLKRRVNESADPVMSFNEVVSMLEDFSVIPGLLRRGDVQKVYNLSYSGPAKAHVKPNPHPKELRYPDFCRLLVRLALLIYGSPGKSSTYKTDEERLKAFGDDLMITSPNVIALQKALAEMRCKGIEKGQMRRDKRMEYVSAASAVELSNKSRDPLAGGSCAARPSWDPCSMAEVPQVLIDRLLVHDSAAASKTRSPEWKGFSELKLDMGVVMLGEAMSYRIVFRNRTKRFINVEVNIEGAPSWLEATFAEKPLAASAPRVVELTARFDQTGEFTGRVELLVSEMHLPNSPVERIHIPVYARVRLREPDVPRVIKQSK